MAGAQYESLHGPAFQTVCGWKFYPEEVNDLVCREIFQKKHDTISASWCLGPVMPLAIWMPAVYIFLACAVASTAAFFSICVDGMQFAWPWWLWLMWFPIGVSLLAIEYNIVRHLSVPYYMKAEKWSVLPSQICFAAARSCLGHREWWDGVETSLGFPCWLVWCVIRSMVRLSSFFTSNMFIGMVLRDVWFDTCSGQEVENIWHLSLLRSKWWPAFAKDANLKWVFVFIFVAQIAHFFLGILHAFPRWNQWQKGGSKPREKMHEQGNPQYEQDFELSVVELISYKENDPRRPDGTRFAYKSLGGIEVTSSNAIAFVGTACGMPGIEELQAVFLNQYESANRAIKEALRPEDVDLARPEDAKKIREAIVQTRTLVQQARVRLITGLSHIFLYGICFSSISLNMQITYLNGACFEMADGRPVRVVDDCHHSSGLRLGVASGLANVFLTTVKVAWILKYICKVSSHLSEYKTLEQGFRELINRDLTDLGEKDRKVKSLRCIIWCYVTLVIPAALMFWLMFLWVAIKWGMATFWCEDHIWNADVSFLEGCVDLEVD